MPGILSNGNLGLGQKLKLIKHPVHSAADGRAFCLGLLHLYLLECLPIAAVWWCFMLCNVPFWGIKFCVSWSRTVSGCYLYFICSFEGMFCRLLTHRTSNLFRRLLRISSHCPWRSEYSRHNRQDGTESMKAAPKPFCARHIYRGNQLQIGLDFHQRWIVCSWTSQSYCCITSHFGNADSSSKII